MESWGNDDSLHAAASFAAAKSHFNAIFLRTTQRGGGEENASGE
jgi:hypothetical protein